MIYHDLSQFITVVIIIARDDLPQSITVIIIIAMNHDLS